MAWKVWAPKRRLTLPEYARECGRLTDYLAFLEEVLQAAKDGRIRIVQLRDVSGVQLPGVEVE